MPPPKAYYPQGSFNKGYVTFDEEVQLEGIAPRMGNESRVEAARR